MNRWLPGLALFLALPAAWGQEAVSVDLRAANQHWVRDLYWEGSGNVKITYGDVVIESDWMGLDWENRIVTAEGNVSLVQGKNRLTAERLVYNLNEESGTFEQAVGSFGGLYQFTGEKITKMDATHYLFERGVFTSCDLDHPSWSFVVRKARVEIEGYAKITSLRFKIHRIPVLYFPYLVWPAKSDRARGLLTPHIGQTFKRGSYLGLAYFIPMGLSYDLTILGDFYSKGLVGGGARFRYNPTEDLEGEGVAYAIEDETGERWWKVKWTHDQKHLPLGFTLNADVEMLSNIDFFREFEKTFERNTNRSVYSHVTLTKTWGLNSLILRSDRRKTVFSTSSQSEIIFDQIPEIEYRMRQKPIATRPFPLYVSIDARGHLFRVDKGENYRGTYGRVDLMPTLSASVSRLPWLSVRPSINVRATYYSKTVDETGGLADEDYTRTYELFNADIVGPSFSRIFGSGERQYKHLVEPRITYSNLFDLEDRQVPVFDENDAIRGKHQVRYALVNRLFLKRGEEATTEVASLEIAQSYNINDSQPLTTLTEEGRTRTSQKSPLDVSLRFYPSRTFNLDVRTSFNAITERWQSLQVSGGARIGMQYANLIYYRTNPQVEGYPKQDQVRLYSGFRPIKPLSIQAQVNYDLEKHYPPQQRYVVRYTGSCYALALEYRDYRLGESKDREYKITFDLKNVGSFLEITGGVDDLFGGGAR